MHFMMGLLKHCSYRVLVLIILFRFNVASYSKVKNDDDPIPGICMGMEESKSYSENGMHKRCQREDNHLDLSVGIGMNRNDNIYHQVLPSITPTATDNTSNVLDQHISTTKSASVEPTNLENAVNGYVRTFENKISHAVPIALNKLIMKYVHENAPLTFVFPNLTYSDEISEKCTKYFERFETKGLTDCQLPYIKQKFYMMEKNIVKVGRLRPSSGVGTFVAVGNPKLTFNMEALAKASEYLEMKFQPMQDDPHTGFPVYLFVRNISGKNSKKISDGVCFQLLINTPGSPKYDIGSFWTFFPEADERKCRKLAAEFEPWNRLF